MFSHELAFTRTHHVSSGSPFGKHLTLLARDRRRAVRATTLLSIGSCKTSMGDHPRNTLITRGDIGRVPSGRPYRPHSDQDSAFNVDDALPKTVQPDVRPQPPRRRRERDDLLPFRLADWSASQARIRARTSLAHLNSVDHKSKPATTSTVPGRMGRTNPAKPRRTRRPPPMATSALRKFCWTLISSCLPRRFGPAQPRLAASTFRYRGATSPSGVPAGTGAPAHPPSATVPESPSMLWSCSEVTGR